MMSSSLCFFNLSSGVKYIKYGVEKWWDQKVKFECGSN
jgi:hypothetical protein